MESDEKQRSESFQSSCTGFAMHVNFMAYTPLKVKGSFQARLQVGNKDEDARIYVIIDGTRNLLGNTSAMTLGILKIGLDMETNH